MSGNQVSAIFSVRVGRLEEEALDQERRLEGGVRAVVLVPREREGDGTVALVEHIDRDRAQHDRRKGVRPEWVEERACQ